MNKLPLCKSGVIPRERPTVHAAETTSKSKFIKSALGSKSKRIKKPMKIRMLVIAVTANAL